MAAAEDEPLVSRRPADGRDHLRHRRLVPRWPASFAHPLGDGTRPQSQVRNASLAMHRPQPISPANPAMVPAALASGSDLPRSAGASRSGDATAVVRLGDCPDHAGVAGSILDRHSVGSPLCSSWNASRSPSCRVCQTTAYLLRRDRPGAPPPLAIGEFPEFPSGPRDDSNTARLVCWLERSRLLCKIIWIKSSW